MIKALIVDDDVHFTTILLEALTEISGRLQMGLQFRVEHDPIRCLESECVFDIYFIDIEMPGVSGIDLVKRLRDKNIDAEFVFVSAYSQYMRPSILVKPSAFIRKEYLREDLEEALTVLKAVFSKPDAQIAVKDSQKDVMIKPSRIMYLKSEEHYVRICAVSEESFLIRNRLCSLEARLKAYGFLRIHLRYVVNLNYVKDYYKNRSMVMKNGERLPISSPYAVKVNETFINWVMSGERCDGS